MAEYISDILTGYISTESMKSLNLPKVTDHWRFIGTYFGVSFERNVFRINLGKELTG